MQVKTILGSSLRKIQSLWLYRHLAFRFYPPFSIREAAPADMPWIDAHFNPGSASRPPAPGLGVTNFIALRKEKIVGFVQLVRRGKQNSLYSGYWLFSLHVWPLYRGLGIGEALSQKVIERARDEKARELSLLLFKDNHAALRLYTKLGFVRVILPRLEKILAKEETSCHRRRITLRRQLR